MLPPKKYFLGSDFYEEMEYIKNNPMVDLFEDMFPEDKKETYESITNIPD